MRISGSTLLNDEYALPWAISIPDTHALAKLLGVPASVWVVAFHLVKRGYVEISSDEGDLLHVEAGECAICFGGVAHQLAQGEAASVFSVENLLAANENPFRPMKTQTSRPAALICGIFLWHHTELNPLFASLPSLLHLSVRQFPNLHQLTDLLIQEVEGNALGSGYVIDRLLELLCAEAVRSYAQTILARSWFGGLNDPIVKQAIAYIHGHPEVNWTVQGLAELVVMSPSRFAARFVAAIGESPMGYVAKWRMNVASRLLQETLQGVDEIALQVGYSSSSAFNRAFKKYLGLPPATWRHNKLLERTSL